MQVCSDEENVPRFVGHATLTLWEDKALVSFTGQELQGLQVKLARDNLTQ
jgi:hypothetical protein